MPYCSNCGEKQRINARYCSRCGQKVDPVTKQTKTNIDIINRQIDRETYLCDPFVRDFISWFLIRLDQPGSFVHEYYLVKARRNWRCNCLYEAYAKYWWPYNLSCPLFGQKVSGAGFSDSFSYLSDLAETFRLSIRENDIEKTRKCAHAMLRWGGVQNHNYNRITDMNDRVCEYFRGAQTHLRLSNTQLGNHTGIYMNSGFTKLYFLLIDDFIMYDGRVGAALGLLGRLFAEEQGLDKIPELIEFSYGSGKVSVAKQKEGDRRDPSNSRYALPKFNGDSKRQTNDNIKASWLLKGIADATKSHFADLSQDGLLNERMTAIQAALFMIGYDVAQASV